MTGQIFTGGEGRIVGPEDKAQALADAMNDLTLQVTFLDDVDPRSTRIYTARMMQQVGVDHPVLAMPESVREQWLNDPLTPAHLRTVYAGALPGDPKNVETFDIVRPGDRHE